MNSYLICRPCPCLDVAEVVDLIDPAIRPEELAPAVHPVPLPLALVAPAVAPGVGAHAVDVVVHELQRNF